YPAWGAQETAFMLSPDFFVLAGGGPQVNAYRVDGGARTGWQSVLRSRIAQRQGLIEASARAVAAAEQAALPILRDALLADLAPARRRRGAEDAFREHPRLGALRCRPGRQRGRHVPGLGRDGNRLHLPGPEPVVRAPDHAAGLLENPAGTSQPGDLLDRADA